MPVPAASAAGCPGAHRVPSAASLSRARRATQCLVGRERARHGLAPLRLDRHLLRAAQRHATDMVLRGYLGHNGPDGTITSRIERSGFPRGHAWTAGETVGFGQLRLATPASVVRSWLASPEHRRILLSPTYRWLGIGVVRGGPLVAPAGGAATYVADLGWRR